MMKTICFVISFWTAIVFSAGFLYGQSPEEKLNAYVEHINNFTSVFSQEKVYLHFDNTCYYLGDTLWFKAYLANSTGHTATDWSGTLYVDLLTQEGNIVESKRYKMSDSQCHGEFALKDSLKAGFYEVRAYTRWMLNFGSEYFFSRVFPVFDAPKFEGEYKQTMKSRSNDVVNYRAINFWKYWKRDNEDVTINFFPEGGHLVKGLGSRVAFKAIGRDGENLDIEGHVLDNEKNIIAIFRTSHDGMGAFDFIPDGTVCTAEVKVGKRTYTFPLPEIEPEGCVIKVNPFSNGPVRLELQRSPAYMSQWLGVTVTCRGKVYSSSVIAPSENSSILLSFPRENIPAGVAQVTVYDVDGEVLAERMIFTKPHNQLGIETKPDKEIYRPFEKIGLDVNISDHEGKPVKATFSLSVRDASQVCTSRESDNILTNLLLSSDLRGYIKNPGWYFEAGRERAYALDLLLLVQGWSRYSWKQMAGSERFKVIHPAEESISIDGKVLTYGLRPKPRAGANVLMWMVKDGESIYNRTVADDSGRFVFAYDVWGNWDMSIEVKEDDKRKFSDIRLNRAFDPKPRGLEYYEKRLPEQTLVKEQLPVVEDSTRTNQEISWTSDYILDEALVRRKGTWDKKDEGLANASIVYDMVSLLDKMKDRGQDNATNIYRLLEDINPYWINGRYKGRKVHFEIFNPQPGGTLSDILPEDIEYLSIDEISGACRYKSEPGCMDYVVIFIYLHKDLYMRKTPKGIRKTTLHGYSRVKEFYSPSYNRPIIRGETDYRRTLYWNPNVQTDSLGRAKVSFYNNSTGKRINVSAETITSEGVIGTTEMK